MFVESPWASIASDYEMHLLEVNRMTDEQIRAYGPKLRAVFGFVKYAGDKEGLQGFIEENSDEFADLPGTVIAAIAELTHSPELKRIPTDDFESEVTYDMCQALTEMMEDSKKEGIREGIKEERANTERERQRADTAERLMKEMQAEIMRLKVQLQYATGQG
ncbi:MAG: hypothetical protein LUI13_04990 [Lachnospiraceae bacterium]|nr:hypothetical protein [Lachnospiraceae bacterium]